MAGTCAVTTPMRSPSNRVLLAARSGVFALFFLESFTSIIISGGNLVHKASIPTSIEYNLALLIKSIFAFLWVLIILVHDQLLHGTGLLSSVWCELTWLSIFSVTELGGAIILLQEATRSGRVCDIPTSSSRWSICHATAGLGGIAVITGVLMSLYFITLAASSIYHGRKYPVFDLLVSVREFNWFPAAGSDQVKMSYEPSIGSFASSPNTRATPRIAPRTMVDLEQAAAAASLPPRYEQTIAPSAPRTKPKHNKSRPPPLKLIISQPLYTTHVYGAPASLDIEAQGPYPQQRHPQYALTLNRQAPTNQLQQFRGNYI